MTIEGSGLGVHRSIDPVGVLPQEAWRLDNRPQLWPGEARLDVEVLALDPVVFRRRREDAAGDPDRLRASFRETVAERSKFHDPATGGSGSLLGTISGNDHDFPRDLQTGERVALPSALGLTPLWLAGVAAWDGTSSLVPARGQAIVFPSSPLARVPPDLDARLALSVEVAAIVAVVRRRVRSGDKVSVLGGARPAGAVASVAAREGGAACVVSTVASWRQARLVEALGAATPAVIDLRDPLATAASAREGLRGLSDLALICDDAKGVEAGGLLGVRAGGTAVFAASPLTCAGLADVARSLSCDVELVIAGSKVSGAGEDAIDLLTTHPALRTIFDQESGLADAPPPRADDRDALRARGRGERLA